MAKKRIYNQQALFGPLYAYLVVISPPDAVKASIAEIKARMNGIIQIGEKNVRSIAHITLTEKLTDDVDFAETVAGLLEPASRFQVKVAGWDFFDHGHSVTVFLKIEYSDPIRELMSLVKSAAKSPHIAIAKKIPHETFAALRPHLDSLDFSAEWICDEVNVLRKLMSEKHLGFRESFKIPLK